jgi:hypothetical protein
MIVRPAELVLGKKRWTRARNSDRREWMLGRGLRGIQQRWEKKPLNSSAVLGEDDVGMLDRQHDYSIQVGWAESWFQFDAKALDCRF